MINGLVSCIIPTYKRTGTLERAIGSIINQTYANIEVLVVDDNDFNDQYSIQVQRIVNAFQDKRIKYLSKKIHKNGAAARNYGIVHANGEYIAFLDDDDEWLSEKIEKQVQVLIDNPDIDAVSCLNFQCKDGELIRSMKPYTSDNLHKKVLSLKVSMSTCTLLFRKDKLDESGYFNEELRRNQEVQLLLDFLISHNFYVLNKHLVRVNIDDNSNRPTIDSIVQIKENFIKHNWKHFKRYKYFTRQKLLACHYLEVLIVACRARNLKLIFKCLLKINVHVSVYFGLIIKAINRKHKEIIQ